MSNDQDPKQTPSNAFDQASQPLPPATDFGGTFDKPPQETSDPFAWTKNPALGPLDQNGKFKGFF